MAIVHDKMDKRIKKEYVIDLEDGNVEDSYISGSSNNAWDSIYEKVLNGISIEEVF